MTTGHSKDSFDLIGTQLRQRYDDAFIRNEVLTLREQVSVLHDTLLAFMGRVDRTLNLHEQRQTAQEKNIKRLLRRVGLEESARGKQFESNSSSSINVASGSKDGADGSSQAVAYPVMDEEGNPTNLIATISAPPANYEPDIGGPSEEHEMDEIIDDRFEEDEMTTTQETEEEPDDASQGSQPLKIDRRSLFGMSADAIPITRHVDWDLLEAEAKTMINLPERKGKGGKISGRLGAGSPAWTHYIRTAIRRSIGDETMLRYARGGSLLFRAEQEDNFRDIKYHVVEFCRRYDIVPPEEKLMDEIAWAFLRNKKRYKAK